MNQTFLALVKYGKRTKEILSFVFARVWLGAESKKSLTSTPANVEDMEIIKNKEKKLVTDQISLALKNPDKADDPTPDPTLTMQKLSLPKTAACIGYSVRVQK